LNKEFLAQYSGSMSQADEAFIYYNPETLAHKKLDPINPADIAMAFNSPNVTVFNDSTQLIEALSEVDWEDTNLLMMSSGNFNGVDFNQLGENLLNNE